MYIWILVLIALFVGALLPIQAASNAATSRYFGDVSYATLLSFIVGAVVVVLYIAIKKPTHNDGLVINRFPPYIILGGVISAIYTAAITFLAPRLGVGNTLFAIIVGQAIAALAVDHYGLLGAIKQELTIGRVFGVFLILLGLYLTKRQI